MQNHPPIKYTLTNTNLQRLEYHGETQFRPALLASV